MWWDEEWEETHYSILIILDYITIYISTHDPIPSPEQSQTICKCFELKNRPCTLRYRMMWSGIKCTLHSKCGLWLVVSGYGSRSGSGSGCKSGTGCPVRPESRAPSAPHPCLFRTAGSPWTVPAGLFKLLFQLDTTDSCKNICSGQR